MHRSRLPLLLLALLGVSAFILLLPRFYPYPAVDVAIERTEAISRAAAFLDRRGHDLGSFSTYATLAFDSDPLVFFQEELGREAAVTAFRDHFPELLGPSWRVTWYQNLPRNAPQERFDVQISGKGDMIGFRHLIPADLADAEFERPHIDAAEAEAIAIKFLTAQGTDLAEYEQDAVVSQRQEKRTDHTFRWRRPYDAAPGSIVHTVQIQGDRVGQYRCAYDLPDAVDLRFRRDEGVDVTMVGLAFAILFMIAALLLVVFFKRYHQGEVSVYRATTLFSALWILLAIGSVLFFYSRSEGVALGEASFDTVAIILFSVMLFVVNPFLGVVGLTAFSVGEALARERLGGKLAALDALVSRRFDTLVLARSIRDGYLTGGLLLGFTALAAVTGMAITGDVPRLSGFDDVLVPPLGYLVPFLSAASGALLSELVFRLFGVLYLSSLVRRFWLAGLLSTIVWSFYSFAFWDANINFASPTTSLLVAAAVGMASVAILRYFDILTVILANMLLVGVMKTLPLLVGGSDGLFTDGLVSLAILAVPALPMGWGFLRRAEFAYRPETTPAHIRRITERERMSRELEIARQVQMRLLPRESPRLPGCDIAGICLPAREVGGDYYDFFPLDDDRIAIAIGDVSGKGVPAAIYMTLTKGIFQSQTQNDPSPGQVLRTANNLIYRTIDRGSFISMFYGILDMRALTLTVARAGHNPALIVHHTHQAPRLLQPAGIALGLERGPLFDSVIREEVIPLQDDDLVVFYTDGFTEAMNGDSEEFGEERLAEVVLASRTGSAMETVESVCDAVRTYVADAPQHDDMTMVVIRIRKKI